MWQGGHVWQGVCMTGGHAWQGRACVAGGMRGREACMARGACMAGGVHEIQSMSGRHASYWNAFLLVLNLISLQIFVKYHSSAGENLYTFRLHTFT